MGVRPVSKSRSKQPAANAGIRILNSNVVAFDAFPSLDARVNVDVKVAWSARLRLQNESAQRLTVKVAMQLSSPAHEPISHAIDEFDIEPSDTFLLDHSATQQYDTVRYEDVGSVNETGTCSVSWRGAGGNTGQIVPPRSDVLQVIVNA